MMIVRTAIRCPLMPVFSFAMAFIMGGKMAVIFLLVIPVLGVGLALAVFGITYRNEIWAVLTPVSYTHLDVYKRQ